MKKEKLKAKAIVLSLVLAVLLPASTVSAQGLLDGSLLEEYYEEQDRGMMNKSGSGSGGYGVSTSQFGSGTEGNYNISTSQFGQESAPLGGGLLILAAAGAGYALTKRKRATKQ